jgi:prophage DNA circulation protein
MAPRVGQMASYRGHAFYVEEVDGVRITRILIHRAAPLAEEHDEIVDLREE